MHIESFTIFLFCLVDDCCGELPKHGNSKLYPSEIVTLALLKALKGQAYRRFLVWLKNTGLFPNLPDYSQLCRLFHQYKEVIEVFSTESVACEWAVIDSVGCEVVHPVREGRGIHWAAKGKSNRRWIVGMKVVAIVSPQGDILSWQTDTANVHDQHFAGLVEDLGIQTLADKGFHKREGDPENLKICERGEQNERMVVESVFSLCKRLLGLNAIQAKTREGFDLAVGCIFAVFNTLLRINRVLGLYAERPSIAHFCCL